MNEIQKEKRNAYMRKYNSLRYYTLRNKAISYLGSKCNKCGSVDNLEIDHIEYLKKQVNLSRTINCSVKRFWDEINKCQLLCKNCHIIKTIIERGKKIARGEHGTISTYRYCKCDLCKKAKSDWSKRNYRQRTTKNIF